MMNFILFLLTCFVLNPNMVRNTNNHLIFLDHCCIQASHFKWAVDWESKERRFLLANVCGFDKPLGIGPLQLHNSANSDRLCVLLRGVRKQVGEASVQSHEAVRLPPHRLCIYPHDWLWHSQCLLWKDGRRGSKGLLKASIRQFPKEIRLLYEIPNLIDIFDKHDCRFGHTSSSVPESEEDLQQVQQRTGGRLVLWSRLSLRLFCHYLHYNSYLLCLRSFDECLWVSFLYNKGMLSI